MPGKEVTYFALHHHPSCLAGHLTTTPLSGSSEAPARLLPCIPASLNCSPFPEEPPPPQWLRDSESSLFGPTQPVSTVRPAHGRPPQDFVGAKQRQLCQARTRESQLPRKAWRFSTVACARSLRGQGPPAHTIWDAKCLQECCHDVWWLGLLRRHPNAPKMRQ